MNSIHQQQPMCSAKHHEQWSCQKVVRYASAIAAIAFATLAGSAFADVELPSLFSDHMVLQREMIVPVWGHAAPGENVTVRFRSHQKVVTAGQDGRWTIGLDPLIAGGPNDLTVAGRNMIVVRDVLVGEVWVGSGQSNMNQRIGIDGYVQRDAVLAAAAGKSFPRIRHFASGPKATAWQEATSTNIKDFSALLFSFGLRLDTELTVPNGLICGAESGTPSVPWVDLQMLAKDEATRQLATALAAGNKNTAANYGIVLARWEKSAAEAKNQGKPEPKRPNPPPMAGRLFDAYIRPLMPYGIRGVLWDQGESGTDVQEVDQTAMMRMLIRGWRRGWGQGDFPFICIQKPSGGGCAWDPASPINKMACEFKPLPAEVPSLENPMPWWSNIRFVEDHRQLINDPNVAVVITTDLSTGLHPPIKSAYGHRASDVALGMVYGRDKVYYGPMVESHQFKSATCRIKFKHVGQGLAFRHGSRLQGFSVAGDDKQFKWADAVIDGNTVVVRNESVKCPVAVRYAWPHQHAWANLFNKDGLPATPFRTDRW